MKTVGVIKSKEGIKGTDIAIKEDASGKKVKLTKNGGAVEQEVYDPLADDSSPAEKPKEEVLPSKPLVSDTVAKAPVKKKKQPVAATSKSDTSVHSPEKVYTTTEGGQVEQEVFDPFADEKGIPSIPGQKGSQVQKKDSVASGPVGVSGVDSLSLAQAKIEADSAVARERRDSIAKEEATTFSSLFFGDIWQPVSTVPKFGFVPLFVGTLKVTLLSILFGAPLAILAALFTSTFAPKWAREILKPVIELLAGFPSVVVGFFALMVMATLLQDAFGYQFRLNAFVGGIAMSFAIIPIIYTISEDALTAVPQALRDASTALGASKWQTAFRVVLPSAIPGVFAAIILGFGRAFGETMIALMATGNASITSANPFEPIRTFAATIGAEMAEVVFGDQHYTVLFLIGALLFVFTFSLNALVEFYVRKRLIKRIQGR
ncbi:MAG: phosphate ABC transporter permease subunit PstC [Bacteroidetes bacterium]|nr:phosphate ABC transporter permease subunit PstC [Bacteroidota bacterium]